MSKALRNWKDRVVSRMQGESADEGAGFVEYAGLLVLVAAIVTAVMGLGLGDTIAGAMAEAVATITGGG